MWIRKKLHAFAYSPLQISFLEMTHVLIRLCTLDKNHITIGWILHPSQFMGLSVHVAVALFQADIYLKGKVAFGLFGNLSKELLLVGLEMP